MNLKSLIRTVPDSPSPGIRFRDITPLLAHPPAMCHVTKELAKRFEGRVGATTSTRWSATSGPSDRLIDRLPGGDPAQRFKRFATLSRISMSGSSSSRITEVS